MSTDTLAVRSNICFSPFWFVGGSHALRPLPGGSRPQLRARLASFAAGARFRSRGGSAAVPALACGPAPPRARRAAGGEEQGPRCRSVWSACPSSRTTRQARSVAVRPVLSIAPYGLPRWPLPVRPGVALPAGRPQERTGHTTCAWRPGRVRHHGWPCTDAHRVVRCPSVHSF